jgi:hypothetical protein
MAETKTKEVVTKTLAQKIADIDNNAAKADKESKLANENSRLKQQIASAKSRRGPSRSSRISGLQGLQSFIH